jgi:hypothetical protein
MPIFRGVGGEFMKGHAKREGCLRSEPKIGALDHETCALFCPVRLELLKQQLAQ